MFVCSKEAVVVKVDNSLLLMYVVVVEFLAASHISPAFLLETEGALDLNLLEVLLEEFIILNLLNFIVFAGAWEFEVHCFLRRCPLEEACVAAHMLADATAVLVWSDDMLAVHALDVHTCFLQFLTLDN